MEANHYVLNGVETIREGLDYTYYGYRIGMPSLYRTIIVDPDSKMHEIDYSRHAKPLSLEVRLSLAKDAVLGMRQKIENEQQLELYRAARDKVDDFHRQSEGWSEAFRGLDGDLHRYKDLIIAIGTESDNECPWDDWDGEPTALNIAQTQYGSGWSHTYGKEKDLTIATLYHYPTRESAIRYINIFMGGVAEAFDTSSQTYIGVFTHKDIKEHFGGDRNLARRALIGSISVFQEWADGGPGYYTIMDMSGNVIDSLHGIYEGDSYHFSPYTFIEAVSMAEELQNDIEADRAEENGAVYDEMVSELGEHATMAFKVNAYE